VTLPTDSVAFEAERRVHAAIDRLVPEYRQVLQELVRIPSPIGREGEAQRFIARRMRAIGMSVDVFDIDALALADVPGFNPTHQDYAGRPCVVGVLKGSGGGRSLILNAHVDTAPVEDAADWTRDPHSGAIEDGRLYGRGAWDDKAGCVECLLIAHALRLSGVAPAGDLIVKIVVEDEATGNGTLACLAKGYVADAAIIVDGTWPERFIVSHMGQLWFRITITGQSAPASVSSRGRNPIEAVGPVMEALRSLADRRNDTIASPWGNVARPFFVNVGTIQSGAWPGAVPSRAVMTGQYGFAHLTVPEAKDDVIDAVRDASSSGGWPLDQNVRVEFWGLETPALVGDVGNPVVGLLAQVIARQRGKVLVESVITGHCDLRHYASNPWRSPIPACLYGPGGGKAAHSEDEYFLLDDLPIVARTIASVVLEWCGLPSGR
jgi:acetylornithine deacetylase